MITKTSERGWIASQCPAVTTSTLLYTAPANTEIDGVLRIANTGILQATYTISHVPTGQSVGQAYYLAYNITISPSSVTNEFSVHCGPGDMIYVSSSVVSTVTFHLSGNTRVTTTS